MQHPTGGRHRRPCRSLAGRVWALAATVLAMALAYVFVPERPRRERVAITPPPRSRELPPVPRRPVVPAPRVPIGDLLAEPVPLPTPTPIPVRAVADDMGDLAAVIRVYLDRVGRTP
ncbi:hypothetical protein [Nocardiopsis synnemataformans]|uniref:hypothetical protein n=1 Tax=Nocardiopsis synnemataformans TaxID=61305 RepID=UPI003EBC77AE